LEPSSSDFSIPKLSSSLLKRANAPLTRRRSSHNPNSLIHTSPSKQTRDDLKREDLTLDWNKFRNWPDGVMEEREARGVSTSRQVGGGRGEGSWLLRSRERARRRALLRA